MKKLISFILSSTILASVFAGSSITVGAETTVFNVDDYNFSLLDDGTLELESYTGTEKEVTIPNTVKGYTVTKIGFNAFNENEYITSVTIPDTVTTIGNRAFYNCVNLTDISLPDTVTTIRYNAFTDTAFSSDTNNWENGALYIGNHFVDSYHTIPDNYTVKDGTVSINEQALYHIKKITIPASVKAMEISAISFTYAEEINIAYENDYYHSIDGVLFDSKSNTLLKYPPKKQETDYKIPDGITGLNPFAFHHCQLTSLTIPTSLNQYAPISNLYVKEIKVEHGSDYYYSIDGVLFEKTTKKLLIYPSEKAQTEYKIPDGVLAISDIAFNECNLLTLTIPASVKEINPPLKIYPDNNLNVAHINVDSSNEYYYSVDGVLFEKHTNRLVKYPPKKSSTHYTIPDNVRIIGVSAFLGSNLSTITVPENVIAIEGNAFSSTEKLTDLTILNPNCNINQYAILLNYDVKIHGYKGSTAKRYSHDKNLKFVSMGESELTIKNNEKNNKSALSTVANLLDGPVVTIILVVALISLIVLLFIKRKQNKNSTNQPIISHKPMSDEITPDQITPDQIQNQITLDFNSNSD